MSGFSVYPGTSEILIRRLPDGDSGGSIEVAREGDNPRLRSFRLSYFLEKAGDDPLIISAKPLAEGKGAVDYAVVDGESIYTATASLAHGLMSDVEVWELTNNAADSSVSEVLRCIGREHTSAIMWPTEAQSTVKAAEVDKSQMGLARLIIQAVIKAREAGQEFVSKPDTNNGNTKLLQYNGTFVTEKNLKTNNSVN